MVNEHPVPRETLPDVVVDFLLHKTPAMASKVAIADVMARRLRAAVGEGRTVLPLCSLRTRAPR